MTAAILFHRFGPYHVARLSAAGRLGDVVAIEISATTPEYAWDPVRDCPHFKRVTITDNESALTRAALGAKIGAALSECNPDVVFVNGWSGSAPASALKWCLSNRVPAVVMSESCAFDQPRRFWKEWVKRKIVSLFSAAFVGGTLHRDYAIALGLSEDRIFFGYDAIDNEYFAAGSDAVRSNEVAVRLRLGLPRRFFLASKRFIAKKNIAGLLRSFATYRQSVEANAWDLVLLGDGPLREDIERQISASGLTSCVHLPGFKQYQELPDYYGLASAFVHASSVEQWGLVVNEAMAAALPILVSDRCGCAPDLVREGVNGFTFPPGDYATLAGLMRKLSRGLELEVMGQASRKHISGWSSERFAIGFWHAAEAARSATVPKLGVSDRILLSFLE